MTGDLLLIQGAVCEGIEYTHVSIVEHAVGCFLVVNLLNTNEGSKAPVMSHYWGSLLTIVCRPCREP